MIVLNCVCMYLRLLKYNGYDNNINWLLFNSLYSIITNYQGSFRLIKIKHYVASCVVKYTLNKFYL